jgi:hypothetical protein
MKTARGIASAAVVALSAASCVSSIPDYPSTTAVANAQDEYVGRKLWVNPSRGALAICEQPKDHTYRTREKCFNYAAGMFSIESAVMGPAGPDAYLVRTADGRTGYIDWYKTISADSETEHKRKLAEKADCDRRGGVSVGMTRAQVYASCWGRPQRINTTTTVGGDHEQLVYGYDYVYLRNGVVTSIQTSRR